MAIKYKKGEEVRYISSKPISSCFTVGDIITLTTAVDTGALDRTVGGRDKEGLIQYFETSQIEKVDAKESTTSSDNEDGVVASLPDTAYKVGDVVEVTDKRCGHGYNIGDKVAIVRLPIAKGAAYECTYGGHFWLLNPSEFKLVKSAKEKEKGIKLKKGDRVNILESSKYVAQADGSVGTVLEVSNSSTWPSNTTRVVWDNGRISNVYPEDDLVLCADTVKDTPPLVEGKIYLIESEDFCSLSRLGEIKNECDFYSASWVDLADKTMDNDVDHVPISTVTREATPEEVKHFEECMAANKWVEPSEYIVGKYYSFFDSKGEWCWTKNFKYIENGSFYGDYAISNDSYFSNEEGCLATAIYTIKPATADKIKQIKACIRRGKWVEPITDKATSEYPREPREEFAVNRVYNGDKVRLCRGTEGIKEMKALLGEVVTVKDVHGKGYSFEYAGWTWSCKRVELVEPSELRPKEPIKYRVNKGDVTIKHKVGDTVILVKEVYNISVSKGDIGTVVVVDEESSHLVYKVSFAGNTWWISSNSIDFPPEDDVELLKDQFKKGDTVRITGKCAGWIGDMDKTIGSVGTIISFNDRGCRINIKGISWAYRYGSFEYVASEKVPDKPLTTTYKPKIGDKVVILDGRATDRSWVDGMTRNIGKTGIVTSVRKTALEIRVDDQISNTWNYRKGSYKPFTTAVVDEPFAIDPKDTFAIDPKDTFDYKVGDKVVILDGRKTDRGWVDSMTRNIGKTGIVTCVHKAGTLVIRVDGQVWDYEKGSYKPVSDLIVKGELSSAGGTKFKLTFLEPTSKKATISSSIIMPDDW